MAADFDVGAIALGAAVSTGWGSSGMIPKVSALRMMPSTSKAWDLGGARVGFGGGLARYFATEPRGCGLASCSATEPRGVGVFFVFGGGAASLVFFATLLSAALGFGACLNGAGFADPSFVSGGAGVFSVGFSNSRLIFSGFGGMTVAV